MTAARQEGDDVNEKPKRTRIVAVRLTEAEYQTLKARSEREKRSASELLRAGCYPSPVRYTYPTTTTTATTSSGPWTPTFNLAVS